MTEVKLGDKRIPFIYQGDELIHPNPVKDGLILWYDFSAMANSDVSKGEAKDLSGNGNDGALQNFNYTTESGYAEGGLKFDGVDDYVNTNTSLVDFTLIFSLELNDAGDQFFFGGDINTFYLRKYLGDRLHASIQTDTQKTIQVTGVFNSSGEKERHSVGLMLDSQRLKVGLIHNGLVLEEWDLTSGTSPFTLTDLGQWGSDSRRLSGSMFSVVAYNRPLTAEEIAHNYAIEKERFNL